jgi:superfamily II DNA/RNA helicase
MSHHPKTQKEILAKLQIEKLNEMQEEVMSRTQWSSNFLILSPTGSGKTLAYLLPLLERLHPKNIEVQALIVVPARELAIQIDQTLKEMGCGYKVLSLYGGRSYTQDKRNLSTPPAIIVGTPGRIAEHLRKETFSFKGLHSVVLDEFDKSLQAGFDEDMKTIFGRLKWLKFRILTSATDKAEVPDYVKWDDYHEINYLPVTPEEDDLEDRLSRKFIYFKGSAKDSCLHLALQSLSNQNGIVFFNNKNDIERCQADLAIQGIIAKPFHGKMSQPDREKSLIQFRNGSCRVLLASDLAGRGIDVPDIDFVMHYHLPMREEDFIHRNGRTARVKAKGTSFVLWDENKDRPYFVEDYPKYIINEWSPSVVPEWKTIEFNVGRKAKISKGDVAGFLLKQGELSLHDIGRIEIQPHASFVAITAEFVDQVLAKVNFQKIKGKKVQGWLVD